MSTTACTSFKNELQNAEHDLDTDVLKVALFTSTAALGAATTAYSATNEVTGTGYTAGGVTVTGTRSTSGTKALLDLTDATWTTATMSSIRYALVYNSSKSNKAIFVVDFTTDQASAGGNFTIQWPAADATNSILRFN